MNVEKLKRLQAQVRIGGKGTPRRKKKVMHQTAATDDKKLQSSLKKLSVSTIPGIEEVNIIKDDLSVIHFNNPKAQASLSANTFAVTGHGENKKIVEMLPEILPQLGQETVVQLRCFANCLSNNQKGLSSVAEEDDVPTLVSDFDEASKHEVGLLKNNTEKKITESTALKNKENVNTDATISKEIIKAGDVPASGDTTKQKDVISNKNKSGQNVKHEAPLKNKDKSNANESKENKKSKKQDKSSSKSAVKKAGEELISATTQLLAEMMPMGNEINVTPKSKDKKSTKNQDLAAANNIKNAKSEKSQLPDAAGDKSSTEKPKSMKETKSSSANKSKPLESDQQNEKAPKITESAKNVTEIKSATVEAAPPITAVDSGDKVIAPQTTVPVEKKSEKSNNLADQQKAKPDLEKPSKIENLKALDPTKPLEAVAPAAALTKPSEDAKSPVKLQPIEPKQPLVAATPMDISTMPKSVESVKDDKGKTSAKSPQKPTEIEKSKKIVEQPPADMKKTVDQSIPPTMNLAEIIKSDEINKNQSAAEAPIEKTKSQNLQEVKPPKQIEAAANKKDDIKPLEVGKTQAPPVKTPEAAQVTAPVSFSEAAKLPVAVEKSPTPLEAQKVIDSKQEVSPNATKPAEPVQKQNEAAKLLPEMAVPSPVIAKSPEVSQAPVKAPEIIQKENRTPETTAKITEIAKAPTDLKAPPPSIDEKPKVEAIKPTPTAKNESKSAPPPESVKEAIAAQAADKTKVTDATKSPKKTNETKKTAPMKQQQQPDTPKALEMKPSSQEAKKTDQIMSMKPKHPSPKPQSQPQSKATPTTSSTPVAPGVPPASSSSPSSSSSSPVKQQKTAKQPEKSQTTTNQPKSQPKSSSTSLTPGSASAAPPKQPASNKSQTTQPAKAKQMSPPKLTEATVATTGNKKTESATVENKTIQKDSAGGGEMKSTKQPSPKPRAKPPPAQQQQQPAKNPVAPAAPTAAKSMQENVAKKQQSQPQTELPSNQN